MIINGVGRWNWLYWTLSLPENHIIVQEYNIIIADNGFVLLRSLSGYKNKDIVFIERSSRSWYHIKRYVNGHIYTNNVRNVTAVCNLIKSFLGIAETENN